MQSAHCVEFQHRSQCIAVARWFEANTQQQDRKGKLFNDQCSVQHVIGGTFTYAGDKTDINTTRSDAFKALQTDLRGLVSRSELFRKHCREL